MIKKSIFIILAFILGFLLREVLYRKQIQPLQFNNMAEVGRADKFITYITYDGKGFSSSSVEMKKGNYLAITNMSKDKAMWLLSDNPDLATRRDYGEGERLQLMMGETGKYAVGVQDNAKASLVISVN